MSLAQVFGLWIGGWGTVVAGWVVLVAGGLFSVFLKFFFFD